MVTSRRQTDDLIDVARVLLLLQGSILIATTIEAFVWSIAFGANSSVVLSGATAATLLVARARLRADRRWTRRLIYIVEGITVVTLALDTALAIAITGAFPPAVALLTRLVLPSSVIALLRRSAREPAARASTVAALEGAS